jgi:hypothetical protein
VRSSRHDGLAEFYQEEEAPRYYAGASGSIRSRVQELLYEPQNFLFFGGVEGPLPLSRVADVQFTLKLFSTFSCTPYLSLKLETGSKLSFLPSNGPFARR